MASSESGAGDGVVELIVREASALVPELDGGEASEEISPLLSQVERPKINIFTASYPRRKPRVRIIFCLWKFCLFLCGCVARD